MSRLECTVILAVSHRPILYNTSLKDYTNQIKSQILKVKYWPLLKKKE